MNKKRHPDEKILLKYIDGEIGSWRRRRLQKHLNVCELCHEAVQQLQSGANLLKESLAQTYIEPSENLSLKFHAQLESMPPINMQTRKSKWVTRKAAWATGTALGFVLILFFVFARFWLVQPLPSIPNPEPQIAHKHKREVPAKIASKSKSKSTSLSDFRSKEESVSVTVDTPKIESQPHISDVKPSEPIISEMTFVNILEMREINDEVNKELIDMIKMSVELLESLNATMPSQKEEDSSWNDII